MVDGIFGVDTMLGLLLLDISACAKYLPRWCDDFVGVRTVVESDGLSGDDGVDAVTEAIEGIYLFKDGRLATCKSEWLAIAMAIEFISSFRSKSDEPATFWLIHGSAWALVWS